MRKQKQKKKKEEEVRQKSKDREEDDCLHQASKVKKEKQESLPGTKEKLVEI